MYLTQGLGPSLHTYTKGTQSQLLSLWEKSRTLVTSPVSKASAVQGPERLWAGQNSKYDGYISSTQGRGGMWSLKGNAGRNCHLHPVSSIRKWCWGSLRKLAGSTLGWGNIQADVSCSALSIVLSHLLRKKMIKSWANLESSMHLLGLPELMFLSVKLCRTGLAFLQEGWKPLKYILPTLIWMIYSTYLVWFWASQLVLFCDLHTLCPNKQIYNE